MIIADLEVVDTAAVALLEPSPATAIESSAAAPMLTDASLVFWLLIFTDADFIATVGVSGTISMSICCEVGSVEFVELVAFVEASL